LRGEVSIGRAQPCRCSRQPRHDDTGHRGLGIVSNYGRAEHQAGQNTGRWRSLEQTEGDELYLPLYIADLDMQPALGDGQSALELHGAGGKALGIANRQAIWTRLFADTESAADAP